MSPNIVLAIALVGAVADAITTRRGKRYGGREAGLAGRKWGERMRRGLMLVSILGCWWFARPGSGYEQMALAVLAGLTIAQWVVAAINYQRGEKLRERVR